MQYSPDDGATWLALVTAWPATTLDVEDVARLPGSDQARIRVIASDGVNTGQATSAVFALSRRPPEGVITEPSSDRTLSWGEDILVRGVALDAEDGPITDTARLTWTSDIAGTLGTGQEILLTALSTGARHIILTATDSDESIDTDEITLFVGLFLNEIHLPLILKG